MGVHLFLPCYVEDHTRSNDWSDIEYLQSSDIFGNSYMISKVLTKKTVIEFAQTNGLDFVSIIPSVVNGPFICPHLTNSIYNLLAMVFDGKKRDLSFLTNLPGAPEKLHIYNADINHPQSFKPAINGCVGVFHVAHNIDLEDQDPEEVKTKRSIAAALAIAKACLDSKTVKKFVYTASGAAVLFSDKDNNVLLDESDWVHVDKARSLNVFGRSYVISKILIEKAVTEFAQTHRLDFVSIVPSWAHGPFICPHLPESVDTAMAMIFGKKEQFMQLANVMMVHVDDVCAAHIFLFENPDAKGRYICSAVDVTVAKLSEFLAAKYPEYPIPTPDALKEIEWLEFPFMSSKKLMDAGFKYKYGLEDMYDAAIRCCKDKGFL